MSRRLTPPPQPTPRRAIAKSPSSKRTQREAVDKLGLSLPVTEKDVKQAYFQRAREAHPDHGGAASEFLEVQRAFEEALEFAKRNGKRLPWIGAQMPVYVAQIEAIELVERLGGTTAVETLDWLDGTVGDDFAQLADRLKGIDLSGSAVTDSDLSRLLVDPHHLPFLEDVNLADTAVSDASAGRLMRLPKVERIDLRGTKVSFPLRRQLAHTPGVQHVEGTSRIAEWMRGKSSP